MNNSRWREQSRSRFARYERGAKQGLEPWGFPATLAETRTEAAAESRLLQFGIQIDLHARERLGDWARPLGRVGVLLERGLIELGHAADGAELDAGDFE